MKDISIDIETFCKADLKKCGVYRYSEDDSFEILLFGYSIDGGPVFVVDLTAGEKIPDEIIKAFDDPTIRKWAYNCMFERVCLSRYVGHTLGPEGWYCTMVWVATLGLPLTLEAAGAVLGLEKQKMKEGKDLIRKFCVPAKPTKANPDRVRIYPKDAPEDWETFKKYNARDVETELGIQNRLHKYPVPDDIWEQYHDDQRINDYGVLVDVTLAKQAIDCDQAFKEKHMERARLLTNLDNPGSTQQLSGWLRDEGMEFSDLSKKSVSEMLDGATGDVEEVLTLRQLISKSSVKKYTAMMNAVCKDRRVHGLFQFHGAHTGRFISRIVQLQNLPQNHISDLEVARSLIRTGSFDGAELLYDSVPDVLSQLIRTSFVPGQDRKFIVSDYSAIEARVIAWLAGEEWRNAAFAAHKDIYCASAEAMFKVPVAKDGPNAHLRQRGKIAELALGYGGSIGALTAMGALDMGLSEDELYPLVQKWRQSNPAIVNLWWDTDKNIIKAVREKTTVRYKCLAFEFRSGMLFIHLPSGRKIAYVMPKITENEYGRDSVSYMGVTSQKRFERIQSYGPRYVENIVQGIARDLLCDTIHRLLLADFNICMHVHDEVVVECPMDTKMDEITEIMKQAPSWAPGLCLDAAAYECMFYQKD